MSKVFSLLAAAGYLWYSPADEETLAVARYTYNTGGDVSLDWQEMELALTGVIRHERYRFKFGTRYKDIKAEQDRRFTGGTVSSSFDQDEHIGLFTGVGYEVLEHLHCGFTAWFVDEAAFEFTMEYRF
jgi:hypothetical protein